MYLPWYLLPSPSEFRPTISSRLSTHLTPSSCASHLASNDHYERLQIAFTYLLTLVMSIIFEARCGCCSKLERKMPSILERDYAIFRDMCPGADDGTMSCIDHSLAFQLDHRALRDLHVRWLPWQQKQLRHRNEMHALLHRETGKVGQGAAQSLSSARRWRLKVLSHGLARPASPTSGSTAHPTLRPLNVPAFIDDYSWTGWSSTIQYNEIVQVYNVQRRIQTEQEWIKLCTQ